MSKTTAVAIAACILFASPALAARGIISTKPSTSNPKGRITITSVDAGAPHDAGIGDVIDSGEETCASGLGLGDVVSFDIVPDTTGGGEVAVNLQLLSPGAVLTGEWQKKKVIAAAEAVLLLGSATLKGKVTVNGGTLVILESASVQGKIVAENGAVVIVGGAHVSGNIDSDGAGALVLDGTIVDGKVVSTSDAFTSVQNCTIAGKLEVLNATTCRVSGNSVGGQTNTPGCTP